ncbi:hypothetical protein SUNI508_05773 [Seiridium unicorne]|uniref:C2H2-type domain-containing protein n=1 Tax=Seiridium unicorne TaxID=138068 RepID=A0ABR2V3P3_9PEZI
MGYQYSYPSSTGYDTSTPVYLDPSLKDSILEQSAPWSHHQISYGKPSYYPHGNMSIPFTSNDVRTIDGTAPLPSALLPRHCSPSDQHSSTCSSARSPPGDSDFGYDYPSTPPDDMIVPPFSSQYDHWVSQEQQQLEHVAGWTNICIKPDQISYYQEPAPSYHDEKPEFPSRGLSMSSNGSSYDYDSTRQLEQIQLPRSMSPPEMSHVIKEEIHVSEPAYPPFESDEESLCEKGGENPQAGDEDDEDYEPPATHKEPSSSASRNSRQRKRSSTSQPASSAKKAKFGSSPPTSQRTTTKMPSLAKGSLSCSECPDGVFTDQASLQKHIKQQHTRPFGCVFRFAGCESTFASKNEWKRHVASQHLLLTYWLCQQDACAKLSNTSGSLTKPTGTSRHRNSNSYEAQTHCSSALPNGAIFNRKDLYTQHLRRMHIPPAVKKQVKAKKTVPEWEDRVRVYQEEAVHSRCELPDYMTCPAPECHFETRGPNAWDERMEHVAKHLEKAATGLEAPITFGGDHDPTLMTWVLRSDVAVVKSDGKGIWALNNPLKPERGSNKTQTHNYGEEDAPGEEIDDE